MLKIDPRVVRGIIACSDATCLAGYLQNAVELEHSTIPPYLTAMYSLKPGSNERIAHLVRTVVIEEMLHMTIAANILIAIGGHPAINQPGFVPNYPGPLPMHIGGDGFIVGIEAFSLSLVENTFMRIEEPEDPIPVGRLASAEPVEFNTIGEFYEALKVAIRRLGDSIFTGGTQTQVLTWFPPDQLFPITDVDSACAAIDVIVRQGEGTRTDPFESPGDPAHYYRFGEIVAGRALVKTPNGYAYAGTPIPFDPAGVYPMTPNPTFADYPEGSQACLLARNFSQAYAALLNALHQTFNGAPNDINAAIGVMYEMRLTAQKLIACPLPGDASMTCGPVFSP